ncbi:DoxX family protein [Streptomyces globosus]
MPRTPSSPALLAGFLAAMGVAHAVAPKPFDAIVPRALPGSPRLWTYASGAAELVVAAGVAHPRTRRVAGLAAAALFAGVFPANLQMAADARHRSPAHRAVAFGRLPLQVPLVLWARSVSRGAASR